MRGVTATRAASSHKDEGKPSGKHANAPNNASNACAQDARRGTFSRGFEPELASALADGERRWARVLDRRGASGPSDAGDDAGDGEGRSPAATAESAPSASRHTSAAIVEPTEEGADPAKAGGADPSEGTPAGARIAAAPADFAPASTAISRSAAAAARDARPSATRAKSAARRTISIASDAGAEDEDAEDEDADPVPDDSVLVPDDSHASLTPTTSAASAASAAASATFGSGSTTARAKTSTAVRHAGPNPRGRDVKHAPNPSTNLARVSASSARTNASRNGRAAASPAAAPAPVASALSNAARATRRIPSAAIDDADESGWPHASTNTRDAVDHTRVHTGRTRPAFAAETSISFASAYGRGETSARAAAFPSEDASASAQRCTRATRASASTNTMASSVSSRVDAENTSFVAAIPSSLDNHAPKRLSAAFGATRAIVAPTATSSEPETATSSEPETATSLESETATSLESESSPLNVSSFAVRSGVRTAEASRASSRASESPRDRNASTRQMTSIAGAHRAPSASVSLAASSTSVRTTSAPWVAIPSGLVPTPEASTRNAAKASRAASARKSAASRNVARAPSSGSAACAASSACANADATARNRGEAAVSSMGRARPGSDAEWKRASRARREDTHSRTARSATSDSASRSRSRR